MPDLNDIVEELAILRREYEERISIIEHKILDAFNEAQKPQPLVNPLPKPGLPAVITSAPQQKPVREVTEEERRLYYQEIVVEICNRLDVALGGVTDIGTPEQPTKHVQQRMEMLTKKFAIMQYYSMASLRNPR